MDQNHHRHHHRSSPFDFDVGSSQIPPRRSLLDRRGAKLSSGTFDDTVKSQPSDSFWFSLHKFLLCNNEEECCWPAVDSFSCDEFRMYEFKVRRCMRGRSHDWTECPFAHPGEKARRRDPRRFHYSCTVCPDFRRGSCRRGDACEFAHGVFECWLHPARYRTQPCKDGRNCKRKVCFFAHTPQQLRVLPSNVQDCSETLPCNGFYLRYPSENPDSTILNRRCSVCFPRSNHLPFLCKASPVPAISTQRGYSHPNPSPPPSPPLSPGSSNNNGNVNNNNKDCSCTGGYPPICSYQTTIPGNTRNILPAGVGYQNLLAMLVNSLEAIDVASINKNRGWDSFESDQQSSLPFPPLFSPDSVLCNVDEPEVPQQAQSDRVSNSVFSSDIHGPDLEWVDELVM